MGRSTSEGIWEATAALHAEHSRTSSKCPWMTASAQEPSFIFEFGAHEEHLEKTVIILLGSTDPGLLRLCRLLLRARSLHLFPRLQKEPPPAVTINI